MQSIKRFFNLAIQRKQIEENSLLYVKAPKVPKKRIRIYTEDEINRLVQNASTFQNNDVLEWDLLVTLAITTGMRKSELLNLVWDDIDFEQIVIEVNAKENTGQTWEWQIKDTDHRTLPLLEDVKELLLQLKERSDENCPYILIPPDRYRYILQLRRKSVAEAIFRQTLVDLKTRESLL